MQVCLPFAKHNIPAARRQTGVQEYSSRAVAEPACLGSVKPLHLLGTLLLAKVPEHTDTHTHTHTHKKGVGKGKGGNGSDGGTTVLKLVAESFPSLLIPEAPHTLRTPLMLSNGGRLSQQEGSFGKVTQGWRSGAAT